MNIIIKYGVFMNVSENQAEIYFLNSYKKDEFIIYEGVDLSTSYYEYENKNTADILVDLKNKYNLQREKFKIEKNLKITSPFPSIFIFDKSDLKELSILSSRSKIIFNESKLKTIKLESLTDNAIYLNNTQIEEMEIYNLGESEFFIANSKINKILLVDSGNSDFIFKNVHIENGNIMPFESYIGFDENSNIKNVDFLVSN